MDWNPQFFDVSPIFAPFGPLAETIARYRDWPTHRDLDNLKFLKDHCIAAGSGQPIRFVPQDHAAQGDTEHCYESKIYRTGQVSTRSGNWHDFFNALVWITFPQAKAALNRIHYRVLMHGGKVTKRGPLRDAATLVDESGVIVLSSCPELIKLLKRHEWKTVFWQYRSAVRSSMRFLVFGHALYEKALSPYVGMTGKGVFFQVEESFFHQVLTAQLKIVDQWLADFLSQQLSSNADLFPIPILGYPEWSVDNRYADYYDNECYFRPLPHKR